MRPKPSGITVMALMRTSGCGITLADTKFPKENPKPILLKVAMQNCGIIWRAWLASRDASLVVLMLLNVHYDCLLTLSIADSFTGKSFQITLPM